MRCEVPRYRAEMHRWWVVGCAFLLALWGWGLGFYGLSVYLVSLRAVRPWSTSQISAAFTAYYLGGAVLTLFAGDVFRRVWPRAAVTTGPLAMSAAVAVLPVITALWQLYVAMAGLGLARGRMRLGAGHIT